MPSYHTTKVDKLLKKELHTEEVYRRICLDKTSSSSAKGRVMAFQRKQSTIRRAQRLVDFHIRCQYAGRDGYYNTVPFDAEKMTAYKTLLTVLQTYNKVLTELIHENKCTQ